MSIVALIIMDLGLFRRELTYDFVFIVGSGSGCPRPIEHRDESKATSGGLAWNTMAPLAINIWAPEGRDSRRVS
jgi:hypothetical protein